MVKKVLKTIKKFFNERRTRDEKLFPWRGLSLSGLGGILDSYELCGWGKCPVPEKKKIIEEDYSI